MFSIILQIDINESITLVSVFQMAIILSHSVASTSFITSRRLLKALTIRSEPLAISFTPEYNDSSNSLPKFLMSSWTCANFNASSIDGTLAIALAISSDSVSPMILASSLYLSANSFALSRFSEAISALVFL